MNEDKTRAIVTVLGSDRVGIIAAVSTALAKCGVNILDLSQTVLQGYFTMIMLVDLSGACASFSEVKEALEEKGREIGMEIRMQREDIFQAMHRI